MIIKFESIKRYFVSQIIKVYPPVISFFSNPSTIAIEASNFCNIKCVTCPTSRGLMREHGNMSVQTFERFINQIHWSINRLNWTFAGEPLMNPNVFKMIKIAAEHGIKSKLDTNGMLLDRYIDQVINSNLYIINIAFEIADKNKNVPQFRKGYDFWKVFNAIKKLSNTRDYLQKRRPIISLNCLIHKYNESVINEAIELGKECGGDFIVFKSININVASDKSETEFAEFAEKWLPNNIQYLRYEKTADGVWRIKKSNRSTRCPYLGTTVVLWNGDVTICCLDYDGDFVIGNIHKEPLLSIWRSRKYNALRKLILRKSLPICKCCTPDIPMKKVELRT